MAKVLIEQNCIDLASFSQPPVVKASASHMLSIDDIGQVLQCTNSSAITLTLPASKRGKIPVGATISAFQDGTGKVSFAGDTGVTVNGAGGLLGTSARYAEIWAIKVDTDRWIAAGSLG